MKKLIILLLFIGFSRTQAVDLGYRFKDGFCQKNGNAGYNPNHDGECGQITNLILKHQAVRELNIKGSNVNNSEFISASFADSDFSHASMRRSNIKYSYFYNLRGANIDFRGSSLPGSIFRESDLQNLIAMGVRAEHARFINCNLAGANFWGSNLLLADFSNSDLRNANLDRTVTVFTNFKGAKFNKRTRLPFDFNTAIAKGMVEVE